ncbi:N-acetylmuramoyl-L-alanine amidase [Neobacillus niacini]|uniref:N-acetylmuramoyl-L-alanine amidase family protein n=1 Tax=Neobacillus niacini TaxID=86668 RepID=UPI0030007781
MKKMKMFILLFIVLISLALALIKVNDIQSIKIEDKKAYAALINKEEHGFEKEERNLKGKTIIIDPGHGGKDVGASGQMGTLEKDVTLKMARNLQHELEKRTGASVILTRDKDVTVSKKERVELANTKNADLFISIHFDAFTSNEVNGITTYYNHGTDRSLAALIHRHLFEQDLGTRDRGVSFGDFFVLRENTKPSILLELGYISNAEDEKRINSQTYQTQASTAIVEGVIEYLSN